ncbi:hypothetical protein F511_16394 [Dorcoceras hygrometricum]|uniref:Uncharacterized protein n=1 Tax=Dorcoceras hygrometricum TaxID=472368 RepID=A0A2Z7DGQ1_9LAMI|nr:hypothetical protein F511_16394 [Dorcoceras hygrometricum]
MVEPRTNLDGRVLKRCAAAPIHVVRPCPTGHGLSHGLVQRDRSELGEVLQVGRPELVELMARRRGCGGMRLGFLHGLGRFGWAGIVTPRNI